MKSTKFMTKEFTLSKKSSSAKQGNLVVLYKNGKCRVMKTATEKNNIGFCLEDTPKGKAVSIAVAGCFSLEV